MSKKTNVDGIDTSKWKEGERLFVDSDGLLTNVIKADFKKPIGVDGYYVAETGSVTGVFMEELGANLDDDTVYVGKKTGSHAIDNPIQLTKAQMTEFCKLWLILHDPAFNGGDK